MPVSVASPRGLVGVAGPLRAVVAAALANDTMPPMAEEPNPMGLIPR